MSNGSLEGGIDGGVETSILGGDHCTASPTPGSTPTCRPTWGTFCSQAAWRHCVLYCPVAWRRDRLQHT